MIILIDGYNLLKQIFPAKRHILDAQKNIFLSKLGLYKRLKEGQIRDIIVVFDAGPSTHATRSVKDGIVILYSGIKSSADDWIIDFTARNKSKDLLVVTLDRKLRETVQEYKADWISVYDFYTLMENAIAASGQTGHYSKPTDLIVYGENETEDDAKNPYRKSLDGLMIEASLCVEEKNDTTVDTSSRLSTKQMLSKTEKLFIKKIKKLG